MGELVFIQKEEPMTSTLVIAEGMKLEHRAVMWLVDKYKERLELKGFLNVELRKTIGNGQGRPTRFAWLNEEQTMFLVTLMKNSEIVLDFKALLTKEFMKQRKLIASLLTQRQNKEWVEQREQGKLSRRQETDTIKDFIEYAKAQGSAHAEKYYIHFTKATYKALFILEQEFTEVRNILSGQQLQILASADVAVSKAIIYGMEQNMHYKEIFQYAKQRLIDFADIVGTSLIPTSQLTFQK